MEISVKVRDISYWAQPVPHQWSELNPLVLCGSSFWIFWSKNSLWGLNFNVNLQRREPVFTREALGLLRRHNWSFHGIADFSTYFLLTQQRLIQHLLWNRCYSSHWRFISEQNSKNKQTTNRKPCPYGIYILWDSFKNFLGQMQSLYYFPVF